MKSLPCALSRLMPTGDAAERAKRLGWLNNKILVVALDNRRLTSAQRAAVLDIGRTLYEEPKGKR